MSSAVHREIARLLARLRRDWTSAVNKQLGVLGFSLHEYAILLCLSEHEEAPQSRLAHDAAIDFASVSRLMRQLTRARVVTTRVDPMDKRQRLARLTPKGQALVHMLSPIVDSVLKPYMCGLTPAEEEELLRLLRKAHACAAHVAGEDEDTSELAAEARSDRVDVPRGRARSSARGYVRPVANQRLQSIRSTGRNAARSGSVVST
jgi:DNA-binding MarR family transcriptional regulator